MIRRFAAAAVLAALLFTTVRSPAPAQDSPAILVVGGTPAGVAAAVAAARAGADVTLVVRRPQLGGILTDGMMDQWDLNVAPDGGTIERGIFAQIHAALGDAFTPQAAAAAFGALIAAEPRIRVITGARVTEVSADSAAGLRTVRSVQFRQANGATFGIPAQYVIDATDNGDVASLAGARYDLGRQDTGIDERAQAVTLMFSLSGVAWRAVANGYDAARYGPGGATPRRAWGYGKLLAGYRPLSPDVLAYLRERLPGFERAAVDRYADEVYVRETRHFAGVERLTATDVWGGSIPQDTIGLSSYPLDLHPVTPTERLAYAPARHVYGIPFGTLVPRDLTNVILASAAISATHVAAGSARVIPTTIEEGEAAGDAAALAQREGQSFLAVTRDASEVAELRALLLHDGAILTYSRRAGRT
jgi:hypothetical protein